MPRLSDTMEQGTVARWLKHEGDHVAEGDVIAEIDTDKATMELTAFEDGVLLKILVGEGESAELGAPIALIGAEGEEVPAQGAPAQGAPAQRAPEDAAQGDGASAQAAAPSEAAREPEKTAEPEPREEPSEQPAAAAPAAAPAASTGELKASPIARRIAAEAGLDLR